MSINPPVEIIDLIRINDGTVEIDKSATDKQLIIFEKFKKEFDSAVKNKTERLS